MACLARVNDSIAILPLKKRALRAARDWAEAKLESFKKLDRLENTPHGLRLYASNLAGSLFSILVEVDKSFESSQAPMTESHECVRHVAVRDFRGSKH